MNTAVNQLDQMTQQNAALVEQSAAAAESLKEQAARLSQVIAIFRTDGSAMTNAPARAASTYAHITPTQRATTSFKPSAKPTAALAKPAAPRIAASAPASVPASSTALKRPQPAASKSAQSTAAGAEGDWESF